MDPITEILRFHRPLDDAAFKAEVRLLQEKALDPNWLYGAVGVDQRELWQGDVLPSLTLPFVNADGEVEAFEGWGMLLSTTCDAVPGQDPSAVVAPVYPFSAFGAQIESEDRRRSQEADLMSNRYARYMYLPAGGALPASYVNFAESASVSNAYLDRIVTGVPPEQRLRFSRLGWYLFNYKLGYYYARAEDETEIPRKRDVPLGWAFDEIARP